MGLKPVGALRGGEERGGCSGQEAKDKQTFESGIWWPRLRMLPAKRGNNCYLTLSFAAKMVGLVF